MKAPKQKPTTLRNRNYLDFSVFKRGKVRDIINCFNIFMTHKKLLSFVQHLGQNKIHQKPKEMDFSERRM